MTARHWRTGRQHVRGVESSSQSWPAGSSPIGVGPTPFSSEQAALVTVTTASDVVGAVPAERFEPVAGLDPVVVGDTTDVGEVRWLTVVDVVLEVLLATTPGTVVDEVGAGWSVVGVAVSIGAAGVVSATFTSEGAPPGSPAELQAASAVATTRPAAIHRAARRRPGGVLGSLCGETCAAADISATVVNFQQRSKRRLTTS